MMRENEHMVDIIKKTQAFVGQMSKQSHEVEHKNLALQSRVFSLEDECDRLREIISQNEGGKAFTNQRRFLNAIHQLSAEALKTTQQANRVDVKVSVDTDNQEQIVMQTTITQDTESSQARPVPMEAEETPSTSKTITKKSVKRTTLPPIKTKDFGEAISGEKTEKPKTPELETIDPDIIEVEILQSEMMDVAPSEASQATTGTPLQDEPRMPTLEEKLLQVKEARERHRQEKGFDSDEHPMDEFDEQLENLYAPGSPIPSPRKSPTPEPKSSKKRSPVKAPTPEKKESKTPTKEAKKSTSKSEQRKSKEKKSSDSEHRKSL